LTVFAWIVNVGGSLSVLGNMTTGLIAFNKPNYEAKGWHITLIMWAFILVPTLCNLFLRRVLNTFETIGGVCHVIFFIAVIVTVVCLGERSTSDFVFKTLTHGFSGWTNPGIAFNLGLITMTFPITSFDGVLHMSKADKVRFWPFGTDVSPGDEVKDPQNRVPRSMIFSTVLNAIMQWAFVIAILFCIGDYDKVSASLLPIVEVYYNATKSHTAATILVCLHGFVFTISLFNIFASVSRLVWAFSRDHGLPFERVFSYVSLTPRLDWKG
jgi:amino acid transporter